MRHPARPGDRAGLRRGVAEVSGLDGGGGATPREPSNRGVEPVPPTASSIHRSNGLAPVRGANREEAIRGAFGDGVVPATDRGTVSNAHVSM